MAPIHPNLGSLSGPPRYNRRRHRRKHRRNTPYTIHTIYTIAHSPYHHTHSAHITHTHTTHTHKTHIAQSHSVPQTPVLAYSNHSILYTLGLWLQRRSHLAHSQQASELLPLPRCRFARHGPSTEPAPGRRAAWPTLRTNVGHGSAIAGDAVCVSTRILPLPSGASAAAIAADGRLSMLSTLHLQASGPGRRGVAVERVIAHTAARLAPR